jgi:indolepyruvate ferredoxin oxidoreductase alpha subunit
LPGEKIRRLAGAVKRLIIIEEGEPFVERAVRGLLPAGIEINGKKDGFLPPAGELNPDLVRKALGLAPRPRLALPEGALGLKVSGRPPQLCAGCPHGDSYEVIKSVIEGLESFVLTSDIGCYALGAVPPYSLPETIVCMGASVGMAKGAAEAGIRYALAVIGDSTFLHSGIPPLIDAAGRNTPMTLVILDNRTVAMTGGQETIFPSSGLAGLVRGLGVEASHVVTVEAHRRAHAENCEIFRRELEYRGLSVIIAVRECIESARARKKVSPEGEKA